MGTKEINPEFENCLKKQKIKAFSRGGALMRKELETAKSDFGQGEDNLRRGNYKWATIQFYYSMFHSARALLYAKGYREASHYCLIVAIRALYVETKQLSVYLIEGMQKAKTLRENADYYNEWSEEGAGKLCEIAREFLDRSEKLLLNINVTGA